MPEIGGPTDHLANERTQLAWLRTSLNAVVLGLAVARFGDAGRSSTTSIVAGAVLVLAGVAVMAYGNVRYARVAKDLVAGRFDAPPTRGPIVLSSVVLLAVVVALVVLELGG